MAAPTQVGATGLRLRTPCPGMRLSERLPLSVLAGLEAFQGQAQ